MTHDTIYLLFCGDTPFYAGRSIKHAQRELEHITQSADFLTDKDKFIFENHKEVRLVPLFETHRDAAADDETCIIWLLRETGKARGFNTYNTTAGRGFEPIDRLEALPTPSEACMSKMLEMCDIFGIDIPEFTAPVGDANTVTLTEKNTLLHVQVVDVQHRHHRFGGNDTPHITWKWLNTNKPGERGNTVPWAFIDTPHFCSDWKAGEVYEVWSKKVAPKDSASSRIWVWEDHSKLDTGLVGRYNTAKAKYERLLTIDEKYLTVSAIANAKWELDYLKEKLT